METSSFLLSWVSEWVSGGLTPWRQLRPSFLWSDWMVVQQHLIKKSTASSLTLLIAPPGDLRCLLVALTRGFISPVVQSNAARGWYYSLGFKQVETCAICLSCFEINRLKITLCIFMLWTGWNLTCASPCFKAETHPVSLHASNRLKLMLCLSCFEINRLKVTLCLFMLWTGWNLSCASSCFKALKLGLWLFML